MLPIASPSARAAFAGALIVLLLGVWQSSPVAAGLGGVVMGALALALGATMPLGRRVRRQRLEFAWWLAHGDPSAGGGVVVPGIPFDIRCYVRHRGDRDLVLGNLRPIVPGGVSLTDEGPDAVLELAGRSRTEFGFRLVAPAAGRVVLHGLAVTLRGPLGLFRVPLYFPNPLGIKVLPRAARRRIAHRSNAGDAALRSGPTRLRRRGGGTEVYELRDLMPGDPFRSIAWKASARAGKLMVKEVEQEIQLTRWLVVDASGTMRGGEPGERKLDFTIETAASEARIALDEGDRVGLAIVDGRLLDLVPPNDHRSQLLRIFDALLAATEVVDRDLTDVDEAEVAAIVGRYLRSQDGVDFGRPDRRWDVVGLTRHVQESGGGIPRRGNRPGVSALREFCRERGIPLPYRPDPQGGSKAPGLAAAIQRIAGREPCSILVITDLDSVGDVTALEAAVRRARVHRHELRFLVPNAVALAKPPSSRLTATLGRVYGHGEDRRLRQARRAFGRLGVPVLSAPSHRRTPATHRRAA